MGKLRNGKTRKYRGFKLNNCKKLVQCYTFRRRKRGTITVSKEGKKEMKKRNAKQGRKWCKTNCEHIV